MLMMRACFGRDEGCDIPADARDACLLLAPLTGVRFQLMLVMRACLAVLRDIRIDAHDACVFAAMRDIRVQLMLMLRAWFWPCRDIRVQLMLTMRACFWPR